MRVVLLMSETLPIDEPIYEFGSLQVAGQEGYADMCEGAGVDVILNLHQIDLSNESVGTGLLLDTLEHVEYPRKAMDELHRIL